MKREFLSDPPSATEAAHFDLAIIVTYGAGFLIAELATAYVNTITGAVLHSIILLVAVLHAILLEGTRSLGATRETHDDLAFFLMCLPLVNLIRLVGLGLPLRHLPIEMRPGIVAIVLAVGVGSTFRASGLSRQELGLRVAGARPEALVAASGLPLGLLGFMLTSPSPLIESGGSVILLVAALLVGCVGAVEEMIFRGLLQKASARVLGWIAVPFTAVLSSATLLSERSFLLVLYALLVSLYFGTWVYRRRCIVGAAIAHGLMAASMFVVWPRVL